MTSMTASITPYCTSQYKQLRRLWLCAVLLLLCLGMSVARAEGVAVDKIDVRISGDGYRIAADFGIELNFVVEQALTHGVPIYFSSEFTLTRPRWYWLDEEVAHSEQSSKLSYNILTRQYRITRGALYQNFDSLEEVLRLFGHQAFPLVPATQLTPGTDYEASVRMRLDVTQLPKPLQVNALATRDWDLDSGWHRWTIRAGASTADSGQE